MTAQPIYFATSNDYKFEEFQRLFRGAGVELIHFRVEVDEIQHVRMEKIIEDKALKAYKAVRRPVIVDHSGLAMTALNDFPGGLNRHFWNVLQERICHIAVALGDPRVQILVSLGICDGRRIYPFHQRDPGTLASEPAAGSFHLDRVFIPEGARATFAEMEPDERDGFSHRRKVMEQAINLVRQLAQR